MNKSLAQDERLLSSMDGSIVSLKDKVNQTTEAPLMITPPVITI